ncbi:Trk system potassium transporter TrkA [Bacteroidota bacterium]
MRIIVAGAGEVGAYLAKMLSSENHDIVVIDPDEEKLKTVSSHFDVLTVKGSSASPFILDEADVKRADLFIGVTPTEELNILSSVLSKNMGAKKSIARINNEEYLFPHNKDVFYKLGVDSMISPERLAAMEVICLLKQVGTTQVYDFSGGALSLFAIKLDIHAPILNKTLIEANNFSKDFDFRAVAITRNGNTIIPKGSDVFLENDLIYVVTTRAGITNLLKFSGKKPFHVKNIMILGGSRIGIRVAKELENHLNVKLIEIDKEKCYSLADSLKNSLIINGDGRDIDILVDEEIKEIDAFIAVTGNSETNILSCLHAKKLGVKKTIVEIENIDYIDLAENIGIDTVINKKFISANQIFSFTMKSEVTSVRYLAGSGAEVLEFVVNRETPITKSALRDLNFPKNAIVAGVVRGKSCFIAKGNSVIKANDKVVVFALPEAISDVEKLFN